MIFTLLYLSPTHSSLSFYISLRSLCSSLLSLSHLSTSLSFPPTCFFACLPAYLLTFFLPPSLSPIRFSLPPLSVLCFPCALSISSLTYPPPHFLILVFFFLSAGSSIVFTSLPLLLTFLYLFLSLYAFRVALLFSSYPSHLLLIIPNMLLRLLPPFLFPRLCPSFSYSLFSLFYFSFTFLVHLSSFSPSF